jgi:hypothetical protein
MSLTFTVDHEASYRGLSSLFPFKSVSPFTIVNVLSQSSFSHSFGASWSFVQTVPSYHAHLHLKVETSCNNLYYTEKHVSQCFLRTFGRGRPPTVAPHSINLFLHLTNSDCDANEGLLPKIRKNTFPSLE